VRAALIGTAVSIRRHVFAHRGDVSQTRNNTMPIE
jgi:hypothetical protein